MSELPELDRECHECGGNGIVTTAAWLEWEKRADMLADAWKAANPGASWFASPEREAIEDEQPDPEMNCPTCGGHGQVLTDAGKRLLAFLHTHIRGR